MQVLKGETKTVAERLAGRVAELERERDELRERVAGAERSRDAALGEVERQRRHAVNVCRGWADADRALGGTGYLADKCADQLEKGDN